MYYATAVIYERKMFIEFAHVLIQCSQGNLIFLFYENCKNAKSNFISPQSKVSLGPIL
jgi:hypothetical protein